MPDHFMRSKALFLPASPSFVPSANVIVPSVIYFDDLREKKQGPIIEPQ